MFLGGWSYYVYQADRAVLIQKITDLESKVTTPSIVYSTDVSVYRDLVLRMGQVQYLDRLEEEPDYAEIHQQAIKLEECRHEASQLIKQLLVSEAPKEEKDTFLSQLVTIEEVKPAIHSDSYLKTVLSMAKISSEFGFAGWDVICRELSIERDRMELSSSHKEKLDQLIALPVRGNNG